MKLSFALDDDLKKSVTENGILSHLTTRIIAIMTTMFEMKPFDSEAIMKQFTTPISLVCGFSKE